MNFTKEDYKKIEDYLQHRSIKDSEFEHAGSLCEEDLVPIVQEGKNKVIPAFEFGSKALEKFVDDIYNVNYEQNTTGIFTFSHARASVPTIKRRTGLFITYRSGGEQWDVWQFQGSTINNWEKEYAWKKLLDSSESSNLLEHLETALATKVDKISGKGLSTNDFTNEYKTKVDNLTAGTVTSVNTKTGDVVLNKSDVGLSNVDNTSDLDKPVSKATQNELLRIEDKTQTAITSIKNTLAQHEEKYDWPTSQADLYLTSAQWTALMTNGYTSKVADNEELERLSSAKTIYMSIQGNNQEEMYLTLEYINNASNPSYGVWTGIGVDAASRIFLISLLIYSEQTADVQTTIKINKTYLRE